MKRLENWDNKTWLSSEQYIFSFNNFLRSKIKFNKNTKILDIGCGRANIISTLQKIYSFNFKAINCLLCFIIRYKTYVMRLGY